MKALSKWLFFIMALLPFFYTDGLCANQDMRGAWVSSVFNLDYPSEAGLSEEKLKKEAETIVLKAKECGLTDLFFQVRPCCDALYNSSLFPQSLYLSSVQGDYAENRFDPLKYFIDLGKANKISIHAWINPYRITKGNFETKEQALSSLSKDNPALSMPDHVVFCDGNLYFDPASDKARQLITDGILEIVSGYEVTGIHLDDYFYPSKNFNDTASYERLKLDNETSDDFRRRQVTLLVYSLYDKIKEKNKDCKFGISPFGVWANKSKLEQGSNTQAMQSYFDHFADTRKWVKDRKLDYIMPQLYWNSGHEQADYSTLLHWWDDVVKDTGVYLYTGLAAYKIASAQPDSPWYGTAEIENQIAQNISAENCRGFAVFRMGNFFELPELSSAISMHRINFKNKPIELSFPKENLKTSLPRFFFCGKAWSQFTINGNTVIPNSDGYFSVSLPLVYGKNSFIFESGKYKNSVTIHRSYVPKRSYMRKELEYSSKNYCKVIPLCTSVDFNALSVYFDLNSIYTKYSSHNAFSVSALKDYTNIYSDSNTDNGASSFIMKGDTWNVSHSLGDFYCLDGLGWVKKENVHANDKLVYPNGKIYEICSLETDTSLIFDFKYRGKPSFSISYDENICKIYMSGISDICDFSSENAKNMDTTLFGSGLIYSFTPILNSGISGYYIEKYDTYMRAVFKKSPCLSTDTSAPLKNIKILLDPGHGGNATGAASCDKDVFEKSINLNYALALSKKLKALGAQVFLTRTEDTDIALPNRFYDCIEKNPDIFISLHSNSIEPDYFNTALKGVSIYTNSQFSYALADHMGSILKEKGIDFNGVIKNSNLYMAKPKSCYSLLIENQYLISPNSFSLLMSSEYMENFLETIAGSIISFLK